MEHVPAVVWWEGRERDREAALGDTAAGLDLLILTAKGQRHHARWDKPTWQSQIPGSQETILTSTEHSAATLVEQK